MAAPIPFRTTLLSNLYSTVRALLVMGLVLISLNSRANEDGITSKNAILAMTDETAEPALQCYSPTRENTPYSEVIKTEVDQPTEVLNYGADTLQFGELWLPKQGAKDAPLLVLVHGGCWLNAFDIAHTHALSTALSRSGYPVWSIEYRRTGDEGGGWPGSLDDVTQAIEYALDELPTHPIASAQIDSSNTVLLGHSAGGHLALLASSTPSLQGRIAGVIGLAAIVDPALYAQGDNSCESATAGFMGGTPDEAPDAYVAANVVGKALPSNTVLLTGSKDSIVRPNQAALLSGTNGVSHVDIEGAGHFDFIDPFSFAFSRLLRTLAELTQN